MTSASELFYNRRSRFGRSSILEIGGGGGGEEPPLDSSSSSSGLHHRISHHNSRRHRQHTTNHHHQAGTTRHHPPHRASLPDRELGRLDQGGSPPASGDVNNSQNGSTLTGRLRSAGTDRLPGTVLLARERLLQRLRGVSISANSQRNRASSSIHHDDFMFEDDSRLADVGDWENGISRELLHGAIPFTGILSVEKSNRPPGLTQEALDSLQVEIFIKLDNSDEEVTSRESEECSICLDSFLGGDKLIYLSCGHKFHFCCLDPWVRICGDCPNCRKAVLITSCRAKGRV